MPKVHIQVETSLPPERVLEILTDFSPARSTTWPGVDDQHLRVHDSGDGWADVTEGNRIGWERERYSWNADAGIVTAETTDSNIWGPGSRWDYRITPKPDGSVLTVDVQRNGKGAKGKVLGALVSVAGARTIRAQFAKVLARGAGEAGPTKG
jgi:hypothetical protein